MATRAKPPTEANEQTESKQLIFSEDMFNAEALTPALDALYAELGVTDGGETVVHISQLNSDGKGLESNVWKGDPSDYDLENLAKQFGSGQYRVKVYVKLPGGPKVVRANKVIAWKLSPSDEEKLRNPPQAAQPDMRLEIQRIIADTMKPMLEMMAARAVVAPPPPTANPLEMMAALAGIMRDLQPQPQPMQQSGGLGQIREVVEIAQMLNSQREPIESGVNATTSDVLLKLLGTFGGPIVNALQQAPAAMPQAALPDPNQPSLTPEQDAMNLQAMKIKMGLCFLRDSCIAGGAPETYAEMIVDQIPEAELAQVLAQPDPIAALAQFEPSITAQREWFNAVLNEVREILKPESEGDHANVTA